MIWEAGNYQGDLVDVAMDTSPEKGTPSINLTFDVKGNRVTVYKYLSEGAIEYTERDLHDALGFNGNYENPTPADFSNTKDVGLYLEYEDYQGEQKARWNLSRPRRPATPPGRDVIARLKARYQNKFGNKPASATPPTSAPPPSSPPPSGETWTKQRAWDQWQKDANNKADAERWADVIRKVSEKSGRAEEAFTSDDWKEVADKSIAF